MFGGSRPPSLGHWWKWLWQWLWLWRLPKIFPKIFPNPHFHHQAQFSWHKSLLHNDVRGHKRFPVVLPRWEIWKWRNEKKTKVDLSKEGQKIKPKLTSQKKDKKENKRKPKLTSQKKDKKENKRKPKLTSQKKDKKENKRKQKLTSHLRLNCRLHQMASQVFAFFPLRWWCYLLFFICFASFFAVQTFIFKPNLTKVLGPTNSIHKVALIIAWKPEAFES